MLKGDSSRIEDFLENFGRDQFGTDNGGNSNGLELDLEDMRQKSSMSFMYSPVQPFHDGLMHSPLKIVYSPCLIKKEKLDIEYQNSDESWPFDLSRLAQSQTTPTAGVTKIEPETVDTENRAKPIKPTLAQLENITDSDTDSEFDPTPTHQIRPRPPNNPPLRSDMYLRHGRQSQTSIDSQTCNDTHYGGMAICLRHRDRNSGDSRLQQIDDPNSRFSRGLKVLTVKVKNIVLRQGNTSYKQVAEELINDGYGESGLICSSSGVGTGGLL